MLLTLTPVIAKCQEWFSGNSLMCMGFSKRLSKTCIFQQRRKHFNRGMVVCWEGCFSFTVSSRKKKLKGLCNVFSKRVSLALGLTIRFSDYLNLTPDEACVISFIFHFRGKLASILCIETRITIDSCSADDEGALKWSSFFHYSGTRGWFCYWRNNIFIEDFSWRRFV